MVAEYNHHRRILIAVLLILLLIAVLLILIDGGSIITITFTITTTTTQKEDGEKQATTTTTSITTTTTQKEEEGEKQDLVEEKQDQRVRRSIARAALNLENPTVFPFLVQNYYENTYYIHPQTKVLVRRVPVNPRFKAFHRCRRCPRPAPITEADWKRYEAAVQRPPSDLWITPLDVAKFRLWLGANPSPL